MGKASKVAKAKKLTTQLNKTATKATHKIRTKLRFYRPKTRITKSVPKTLKSLSSEIRRKNNTGVDYATVLVQPVSSDKNMTKMENENTITFIVGAKAKKSQIKEAFEKLYATKVRAVRTLNCIGKRKKAYIRLYNDGEALNVASKIGIL
jgi:large subunit ribosomal protein L23Ae